ncbi:helix-turn-helix transcriptional regulator [Paenibacillus terrae]|uniref:Transcriptional regulator n=1 Tax=Paenibacillus terrae TaxID=159743 RepID=A0A0D7X6B4_9BACL|nr:WYL domain-containing protein [Paenibacillus terrae]KJD46573.1 transcriptional regulator [Paenibacillus terrae]
MTDRLIRLMRIITIVQANPGILARELAERCETSERTIYRDMEALSAMHIPIANMGHGKGYIFISNFALYPLNWTEEEAQAFARLGDVMETVKPLLPPAFESAYEKVMASSQKKKMDQTSFAQEMKNIVRLGSTLERENQPYLLRLIVLASLTQQTIEAEYSSPQNEDVSLVQIDPYCLVPQDRRFYMLGFCHKQAAMRTFRISRFRNMRILPYTFQKNTYEMEMFFKGTWSVTKGDQNIRFVVRFSAGSVYRVKEEELFIKPFLKDLPDGSLLFEVTVNHDGEFLDWLTQYGAEAEILEPLRYRKRMQEMLRTWGAFYSDKKAGNHE